MDILVRINTDDLLEHTSVSEDREIANSFLNKATDDALVKEVCSRGLAEEVLDSLSDDERRELFESYGFVEE